MTNDTQSMLTEDYYKHFLSNKKYPRQLTHYDFKKLINFSSSDYLGLSKHPLLIARSQDYAQQFGVGASASRLVSGNLSVFHLLEEKIAAALGKPTALIMSTGYQANTSVLEALLDPKILKNEPLVFCDKLCHSSLITSTRRITPIHRFRHNDLSHLALLLEKYARDTRPKFIIIESIYSMDGDQVDFEKVIFLAKTYHAFLYVDDAHAIGVYGNLGLGQAVEHAADIDMIMGTFSKALGSAGAYIACSSVLRDYLLNQCKGFMYSTAPSPAVLGAMDAAWELIPSLEEERRRIKNYAERLRDFFKKYHLDYGTSTTHIVPWIIGDAEKTLQISELLLAHGILATAIRPPSVPPGKSRIRFCLSAAHSEKDFMRLLHAIDHICGA